MVDGGSKVVIKHRKGEEKKKKKEMEKISKNCNK